MIASVPTPYQQGQYSHHHYHNHQAGKKVIHASKLEGQKAKGGDLTTLCSVIRSPPFAIQPFVCTPSRGATRVSVASLGSAEQTYLFMPRSFSVKYQSAIEANTASNNMNSNFFTYKVIFTRCAERNQNASRLRKIGAHSITRPFCTISPAQKCGRTTRYKPSGSIVFTTSLEFRGDATGAVPTDQWPRQSEVQCS